MINKDNKKRGFVILYTVLIASMILLISIGLSHVGLKEIILSQSSGSSHSSFFSADTGAECALFFDLKKGIFTEDSFSSGANCNNQAIQIISGPSGSSFYPVRYSFNLETNNIDNNYKGCARVTVDKIPLFAGARIESLGYNVSCDEIENNPRLLVERAIRVTY